MRSRSSRDRLLSNLCCSDESGMRPLQVLRCRLGNSSSICGPILNNSTVLFWPNSPSQAFLFKVQTCLNEAKQSTGTTGISFDIPSSTTGEWPTRCWWRRCQPLQRPRFCGATSPLVFSRSIHTNRAFEPFTFNIYTRRVSAGEFVVVNPYLVQRLEAVGLWNEEIVHEIMRHNGSIQVTSIIQRVSLYQQIALIDNHTKRMFQTAFELKQKVLIDLAADRGRFVDQSQSLNLFVQDPTLKRLTAMHQYCYGFGRIDTQGTRTNGD